MMQNRNRTLWKGSIMTSRSTRGMRLPRWPTHVQLPRKMSKAERRLLRQGGAA